MAYNVELSKLSNITEHDFLRNSHKLSYRCECIKPPIFSNINSKYWKTIVYNNKNGTEFISRNILSRNDDDLYENEYGRKLSEYTNELTVLDCTKWGTLPNNREMVIVIVG